MTDPSFVFMVVFTTVMLLSGVVGWFLFVRPEREARRAQPLERTGRGFRIFGKVHERDGGVVWVQESSLAFDGPHVRVLTKGVECKDHLGYHHKPEPHLSVEQAKELVAALQAFIDEAEAGDLTESGR